MFFEIWVLLAAVSILAYSFSIIFDKITLEDIFPDEMSWLTTACLAAGAPLVLIAFINKGIPAIPMPEMFLGLGSGILAVFALNLYARVMRNHDVDIVSALLQMAPLHAALLGMVFLNEHMTLANGFGMFMIVLAGVGLSFPFKKIMNRRFGLREIKNTPFLLIQFICLLGVLSGLSADYLVESYKPLHVVFYYNAGIFACFPFLFALRKNRKTVFALFRKHGVKLMGLLLALEGVSAFAEYCLYEAYAAGPFALITTLAAIEPFIVLFLILTLSRFFPRLALDAPDAPLKERAPAFASIMIGIHFLMF